MWEYNGQLCGMPFKLTATTINHKGIVLIAICCAYDGQQAPMEYFRDVSHAYQAFQLRQQSSNPMYHSGIGTDSPSELLGDRVSILVPHAVKMVEYIEQKHLTDVVGAGYFMLKDQLSRPRIG